MTKTLSFKILTKLAAQQCLAIIRQKPPVRPSGLSGIAYWKGGVNSKSSITPASSVCGIL